MSTLTLRASDVTGQKAVDVPAMPGGATVTEMVQQLLARLGLVRNDAQGLPLTYRARVSRSGRQLHGGEIVGDALEDGDEVVLQPHINAGGCARAARRTGASPKLPAQLAGSAR